MSSNNLQASPLLPRIIHTSGAALMGILDWFETLTQPSCHTIRQISGHGSLTLTYTIVCKLKDVDEVYLKLMFPGITIQKANG